MLPAGFLSLHSTLGAIEIGSQVSTFLFGIVTLQTYAYFQRFQDDRLYLRAMLWAPRWGYYGAFKLYLLGNDVPGQLSSRVLQLAHTICILGEVYRATIVDWGDVTALLRLPSPFLKIAIILAAVITWISHSFYAWRAWRMLPNPWRYMGPLAVLVTTLRLAGSTVSTVKSFQSKNYLEGMEEFGWLIKAILSAGAAIDLTLAFSMVFYLHLQRGKVLERSMRLIDHLMHYTIGLRQCSVLNYHRDFKEPVC
ncbi:hypothetical protein CC1G_10590 [Coprinopsis cinerea okayama7|uniref:Uncharacterized protein n=1 Tax=Coprinopsis cinerea (strain Okayama-7 / 130 / ATCC MYA-4618 / FGSC 9003) TaxID=240176 RepID=A8P8M2_COPC7|nr:hypothetical protein CC1G_10590 [Coprinopsis cinerea okayama7\|eukprot:XP_001839597.2 hypothetical protein CC1G_10590 [Coprinopsis cinerea okayama7\